LKHFFQPSQKRDGFFILLVIISAKFTFLLYIYCGYIKDIKGIEVITLKFPAYGLLVLGFMTD